MRAWLGGVLVVVAACGRDTAANMGVDAGDAPDAASAVCTPVAPVACGRDADCASDVCDLTTSTCVSEPCVVYADPAGSGSLCARSAPCSIDDAFLVAAAPRNTIKLLPGAYTSSIAVQASGTVNVDGFGATWNASPALTVKYAVVRLWGGSISGPVRCTCMPSTCTKPFGGLELEQVSIEPLIDFGSCGGSISRSIVTGTVREIETGIAITNSLIVSETGIALEEGTYELEGLPRYGHVDVSFSTILTGPLNCGGLSLANSIVVNPAPAATGDTLFPPSWYTSCAAPSYSIVSPQGGVVVDPGFTDVANNDYTLMLRSPAVRDADPAATDPVDLVGNARPAGGASIGAFEFEPSGPAGPATQLVLRSGNNQSDAPGVTLGAPLRVMVEDTNGVPVSGVPVTFAVTAGGGSVSAPSTTSDAIGWAQTQWTVGASGTNTVEARAAGLTGSPVVFTAGVAGFSAHTDFPTGMYSVSVAAGDVNGDGKPDLAVANMDANTVSILLDTTPTRATTATLGAKVDFATGTDPYSVAIGDLNADGKPDLVVANSTSNTVSVLLNTTRAGATTPRFAAKVDFATGTTPYSVAIGDINRDGKPDLVVANYSSNTVSVLLNATRTRATTPSFAASVDFTTGVAPVFVAIGDVNGDGSVDLAVANSSNSSVSVLLNTTVTGTSTPSFAANVDFPTPTGPLSFAIGDINGDGKPDLAVANSGANNFSVLLNTTTSGATIASFAARVDFPTGPPIPTNGGAGGSEPRSIAIGDVNGDGKPDVVVADFRLNQASIFLNTTPPGTTRPSLATILAFPTGDYPYCVAISDFNGDGKPDLAFANTGANTGPGTASVLLAQ